MRLLKQFFTWWNGANWNTLFYTWLKGEFVGTDQFGNRYYRAPSAVPDSIPEHRWVIYAGQSEASQVPPRWHGWIHHRVDTVPAEEKAWPWQKPYVPNMTGTVDAYHPPGSIAAGHLPVKPAASYQAWKPE